MFWNALSRKIVHLLSVWRGARRETPRFTTRFRSKRTETRVLEGSTFAKARVLQAFRKPVFLKSNRNTRFGGVHVRESTRFTGSPQLACFLEK